MRALDGTTYKGREVRCNDADEKGHGVANRGRNADTPSRREERKPSDNFARFDKKTRRVKKAPAQTDEARPAKKGTRGAARMESGRQDDWRQFFQGHDIILKGDEPDFSEEGWARRKPKKKR